MFRRVSAVLGAGLLLVIGVLRGIGGVVLLVRPAVAAPEAHAAGKPLAWLGVDLVVVGIVCIGAGLAVLAGRARAAALAYVALALFVAGGVLNGAVLYGAPHAVGLVGNVAAAVIAALLVSGAKGAGADEEGPA